MRGQGRPVDVSNRHPGLSVSRRSLEAAVRALDSQAEGFQGGCPKGSLSVAFLTDRALARLHARYLGDPSATDVITFVGDAQNGLAGEICVSVDAALRRAGRSQGPFSCELALYVVHGWLHLAGYDDLRPRAKQAMRRAEARAMRLLRRSAAIPRFKLA